MSLVDDTNTPTLPPCRRLRPYLNWLEHARDRWKTHAVEARAEALSLRRQVRRLTSSRDHWRQLALESRRQLRQTRQELEKNVSRS